MKDARATFLALNAEEQAQVSNALTLENKISDLTAAMGVNPDFSLTYAEHFPEEQKPDEPAAPGDDDGNIVTVIIIVAASLVAVAGAAVAVVLILKRRSAKKSDEASNEETLAQAASDVDEKVE